MGYKSDIEIAQECEMLPITQIAQKAGIDDKYLEQYGKYKAKIDYNLLKESDKKDGKLILVTAINPTPAGEGKTTTTVGLADGMQKLGSYIPEGLKCSFTLIGHIENSAADKYFKLRCNHQSIAFQNTSTMYNLSHIPARAIDRRNDHTLRRYCFLS